LAISRKRKEELVKQYVEYLQTSEGVILADYRGLRVGETERLRRSLREQEAAFQVIKNRLFKLAMAQVGVEMPQEWLDGPTAAAFCRGQVPAVAKAMDNFGKEFGFFSIKGGMIEADIMPAQKIMALASLPSKEVLQAQTLGTINAPASRIVGTVANGIRQVLNLLQAYMDKLEGASPASQAA